MKTIPATKMIKPLTVLAAIAIAVYSAGCFYSPVNGKTKVVTTVAPLSEAKPGPRVVSVDSRWAYTADENIPGESAVLDSARRYVAIGGTGLNALVQRWPDAVVAVLRNSVVSESDLPLRLAIADVYDHLFPSIDPGAGWSTALAATESQRDAYRKFSQEREQILGLFHSGQFAEAEKIKLEESLPKNAPPTLRTEALRLTGLALLLNNKPDRAAESFSKGIATAATGPSHEQFEIGLLRCEAYRRLGDFNSAGNAWQSAVATADNVRDPELWERAIAARPDATNWPAQAALAGANEPDFAPGRPPETGDVLIGVGKMRLSRGAPQPALLAFSRAETETTISGKKALARLYRAQTMIVLQQAASALPMLEALVTAPDPRIAVRAEAVQGDVLCRVFEDHQHGIPLMQEALFNSQVGEWPGKSQLIGNLGLYDIIDGRDDVGLRLLHQAQAAFEAQSQWENLAASLKDESASLQVAGKSAEAEAVQSHADDVCRKAGLQVGPLIVKNTQAKDDIPTNPLR